MITLYLDGQKPLRVVRDGPALRVQRSQSADRLFPLQRLYRIVVSGQVEWCTAALLACAEANVPVYFLSGDGILRAKVLGFAENNAVLNLNETFDTFLDKVGDCSLYHEWIRAKSQQSRLRVVRQADRGLWPTQAAVLRRLLFERARHHARSRDIRRFDKQIYGLLYSHLEKLFAESGFNMNTLRLQMEDIKLVRDFTEILIWSFQNPKLSFFKHQQKIVLRQRSPFAILTWEKAIAFYEKNSPMLKDEFRSLLRSFHLHLLEEIYPHAH